MSLKFCGLTKQLAACSTAKQLDAEHGVGLREVVLHKAYAFLMLGLLSLDGRSAGMFSLVPFLPA